MGRHGVAGTIARLKPAAIPPTANSGRRMGHPAYLIASVVYEFGIGLLFCFRTRRGATGALQRTTRKYQTQAHPSDHRISAPPPFDELRSMSTLFHIPWVPHY
jgi:hypothetical protein